MVFFITFTIQININFKLVGMEIKRKFYTFNDWIDYVFEQVRKSKFNKENK